MSACENNTGVDFWLNIQAYELTDWLKALNRQQDERLKAMKQALKRHKA